MSNEVVRQAVIGVESAFSTALVNDVAEVLDKALWAGGTATSGIPIGMGTFTGSTNAGTVASTALESGNLYDIKEYDLPDTAILLYYRTKITVGMDQRASITHLDQTCVAYDEVAIRVTARYDTKPMHDAAVVKLNIS